MSRRYIYHGSTAVVDVLAARGASQKFPTVARACASNTTSLMSSEGMSILGSRRCFSSVSASSVMSSSLRSERMSGLGSRRNFSSVSALSLTSKKRHGNKISMVTAYDFPSAVHVARAGIDVLLVGDSAAMVELGYETTQPITLEQMIVHCQSVKRGVQYAGSPTPLLVGDMPFGSYEYEDTDVALRNAYRLVKEAGMDSVKLEVRSFFVMMCPSL